MVAVGLMGWILIFRFSWIGSGLFSWLFLSLGNGCGLLSLFFMVGCCCV